MAHIYAVRRTRIAEPGRLPNRNRDLMTSLDCFFFGCVFDVGGGRGDGGADVDDDDVSMTFRTLSVRRLSVPDGYRTVVHRVFALPTSY